MRILGELASGWAPNWKIRIRLEFDFTMAGSQNLVFSQKNFDKLTSQAELREDGLVWTSWLNGEDFV